MSTKLIPSTDAQNNFGRILDDIVYNGTRYIVQRRGTSQVIILSLADFEGILLSAEAERKRLGNTIKELSPVYALGEQIDDK